MLLFLGLRRRLAARLKGRSVGLQELGGRFQMRPGFGTLRGHQSAPSAPTVCFLDEGGHLAIKSRRKKRREHGGNREPRTSDSLPTQRSQDPCCCCPRFGFARTTGESPPGSSSSVAGTYVQIRGKWSYLYRAVDRQGRTIDFLLRPDRRIAAAQAFSRKAASTNHGHGTRKATLDGNVPSRRALWLLRREALFWRRVKIRTNHYLNNSIEQDHRAIKR